MNRKEIFLLSEASGPSLWHTQRSVQ